MKYYFLLISLFFSLIRPGQIDIINQSLTDSSLNILYIGVDNRIKIKGAGIGYELTITGGGGNNYTIDSENEYIVRVNSVTDLCYLSLKKGSKNIFRKNFKVRTITSPIATLGSFNNTAAKVNALLVNPFLSVTMPGCYMRVNFRVTSFQATFIQNADSIATTQKGYALSEEQIRMIKTLNPGDKIYFDDFSSTMDGRNQKLSPFWIKIE